jgi:hypothetical protein
MERIALHIGVAANFGALIGVLLIVVQLYQARELTRSQIRHELSSGATNLLLQTAVNAQLASIVRRGDAGETLTPDEGVQYRSRTNALLRYMEDVHYQYRQGLYDLVEFERQRLAWERTFKNGPGTARHWCTVRVLYSPPFVAEIDKFIPKGTCPEIR